MSYSAAGRAKLSGASRYTEDGDDTIEEDVKIVSLPILRRGCNRYNGHDPGIQIRTHTTYPCMEYDDPFDYFYVGIDMFTMEPIVARRDPAFSCDDPEIERNSLRGMMFATANSNEKGIHASAINFNTEMLRSGSFACHKIEMWLNDEVDREKQSILRYNRKLVKQLAVGAPPSVYSLSSGTGEPQLHYLVTAVHPYSTFNLTLHNLVDCPGLSYSSSMEKVEAILARWRKELQGSSSAYDLLPTTLCVQAVLEWKRIMEDPYYLMMEGYIHDLPSNERYKNRDKVPSISLSDMVLYFPHYIRFHEIHSLAWYAHPFRFIHAMKETDLAQASPEDFSRDRNCYGHDELKADEAQLATLLQPLRETGKPGYTILPCSWRGSAISRLRDMTLWGYQERGAELDRHTLIPHVCTFGLPHYQQTTSFNSEQRLQLPRQHNLAFPMRWAVFDDDLDYCLEFDNEWPDEGSARTCLPEVGDLRGSNGIFKVAKPDDESDLPTQWIFDGDSRYACFMTYPDWPERYDIAPRSHDKKDSSGDVGIHDFAETMPGSDKEDHPPSIKPKPRSTKKILRTLMPSLAEGGPALYSQTFTALLGPGIADRYVLELAFARDRLLSQDPNIKLKDIEFHRDRLLIRCEDAQNLWPNNAPYDIAGPRLIDAEVSPIIVGPLHEALQEMKVPDELFPKSDSHSREITPRFHPAWYTLLNNIKAINVGKRTCSNGDLRELVNAAYRSWNDDLETVKKPLRRYELSPSLEKYHIPRDFLNSRFNYTVFELIWSYIDDDPKDLSATRTVIEHLAPLQLVKSTTPWFEAALRLYGVDGCRQDKDKVKHEKSWWPVNLSRVQADLEIRRCSNLLESVRQVINDLDVALPDKISAHIVTAQEKISRSETFDHKAHRQQRWNEHWETATDPGSLPSSCWPTRRPLE